MSSWLDRVIPPGVRSALRRTGPEQAWTKDPSSGELLYVAHLEDNQLVSPTSGYHFPISARKRLKGFLDDGTFDDFSPPVTLDDPLKFRGPKRYSDSLQRSRGATGLRDAILAAHGYLTGIEVIVAAHEFEFIGGSLGTAAGTTLVMAFQRAGELRCPIVVFACSGGARLQEGIFSLMQMPRVTAALQRFREHSLPYVVVLANPSSGGVAASYGMLGDVTIAEPGARIGFAGQRVIEGTIRQQLPPGFQTAEFLLKYGMVDMIVDRRQMRSSISRVLRLLMKLPVS